MGLAEIHLFPRSPYIRMRSFICLFKSLLSKGQNKNCAQLSGHGKGLHNAGQIESRIMYIRVIVSSWITSLTCGQLTSQSHTCVQKYKMLGDKMNQNVVEATMMTERDLQQAGSSKSQAEEQQTLSMQNLENISTELQHHPSDLPVNRLMLRGVGHCNRCWNQLTKTKQEMSPASCRFCWNHQRS